MLEIGAATAVAEVTNDPLLAAGKVRNLMPNRRARSLQ
jgi:hypothetical protein